MAILNNTLYMYGGIGLAMHGDLWKVDVRTFKWTYEPLSLLSILDEPKKRYGHTLTASKNALYVFGGITHTRNRSDN
jgi:N-acetylneuraminic acid mutarotase